MFAHFLIVSFGSFLYHYCKFSFISSSCQLLPYLSAASLLFHVERSLPHSPLTLGVSDLKEGNIGLGMTHLVQMTLNFTTLFIWRITRSLKLENGKSLSQLH